MHATTALAALRLPRAAAHRRPPLIRGTYGLALGTVAVGTSGHSVASLLPVICAQLRTSPTAAGQLATVFALVCGLSAPVISAATRRWDRRRLLVTALTVTALGNAAAAAAPTYPALLGGRVLTALGAATATALAVGIAAGTHTDDRRGRAIALVLSGLALALLLGVPAAGVLADQLGYRPALWALAALCVLAAAVIATTAPTTPSAPSTSLRAHLAVAVQPGITSVLGGGLLAWTSTGVLYPYLAVVVDSTRSTAPVGALLAAYGVGALVGTLLGGRWVDRVGPRGPLLASMTAAAAALLAVVFVLDTDPALAVLALVVWGAAGWSTTPALNAALVDLAVDPTRAALLLALAGSAVYLGLGAGALLGGLVLAATGPAVLPFVAAALSLLALRPFHSIGPSGR